MDRLLQDIRQALRSLLRHKGVATAALLTLGLGLGVTTAIYSVVDGVLLRPLPYPDSEQLVRVSEHHPGATGPLGSGRLSNLTLDAWNHAQTLEGLGAYSDRAFLWTTAESTVRIDGGTLSPVVFRLLRVTPFRGRFFTDAEEQAGADAVVVLSHAMWIERYGGRETAIGERLRLDDREYQIVGVTPPDFHFPSAEARLWTPQTRLPRVTGPNPSIRTFQAIGRMRPGITPERAASEATAAARSVTRPMVADLLFGKGGPVEVTVARVLDEATADVKPALVALTVGVGLVLLVACANVANLLLSYGLARRREIAVRAALGASRPHLLRLLLIESLLLATGGIALGLVLALFVIDALPVLAPPDFPRLDNVMMNGRVILAGAASALLAALLSGLLPAWRGSRADLSVALKDDDGRSAGMASARLRSGLLVVEAALALVLIVGAGLLVRSMTKLAEVDPGYSASNVLTARVYVTGASATPERRTALVGRLLQRVRALPGVVSAGAGSMAPFGDSVFLSATRLPTPGPNGEEVVAQFASNVVTPGFAEALGLRLIAGRTFRDDDATTGGPVIVSETFARRYLNDGRPVAGRSFAVQTRDSKPSSFIAGVVRDIRPHGPRTEPRAEVYFIEGGERPIAREINLLIRTSGDPVASVPALRDVVGSEDRYAALDEVGTMAGRLSTSIAAPRFFATILTVFAGLALVLAAVGLYGVLSYGVTLRRRELGVRAALGASRRNLLALIVRQGLVATMAGLTIGVLLALWAARLMRALLFGIEPTDLTAFAAGGAILLAVAIAASVIPARRAATSDPLEALRHD